MKLSVVIAAYNERENVGPLTERLVRTLDGLGVDWELVYVVEGTDGTREAVEAIAHDVPRVKLLYRAEPSGLGAAFRRGFAAAQPDADVVVTMDADLNHQPEEIPALLAALSASRADIVVGSRFVHGSSVTGIPLWKRALSTSMNAAMRVLWDLKTRDKTSGFRAYRGDALRGLSFRNDNFAFLPELLIDASRKGFSIVEVPIRFTVRVHGVSKMHILKTSRSYLALLRSRWDGWSLFALLALAGGVALRAALLQAVSVSDTGTAFAPLLSGVLLLLAFFFLARRLVGRQAASFALLVFAFPPPFFLDGTSLPNGRPGMVSFGLAALWAAVESREHADSPVLPALFGVAAGLALWKSPEALVCLLPGALLVALSHRGRPLAVRALALAAAGFALGAAPWLASSAAHPPETLRPHVVARLGDAVSNLKGLALVQLPELVTRGADGPPVDGWRGAAAAALVALNAAAVLLAFRRPPEALRRGRTIARGLAPLGL
ncbi:MAG TPA: glycosyltransferase, partial [Thermoanaerobaculia bacterium]|nr:glycosyltransferase [Thermoanaerobaculia bacterium]